MTNGPTWNTITELDASTGVVVRTIHIPWGALRVSADGTHIWVSNRRGLEYSVTELNASDGSVAQTFAFGPANGSWYSDVSSAGGQVWVTNSRLDTVYELPA